MPAFEALRPRRPRPLWLNMRRQCLRNLRPLCRVSRPVEAHAPAPVRIGLVNARSLENKTFILLDFFSSHDLDFLSVTETWLSAEELISWFYSSCQTILDSVAPLKTKQPKTKTEPWFNDRTRAVRRECRRAERRWKRINCRAAHTCRRVRVRSFWSFWTFRYLLGLKSDAAMFSQSSANIPAALILILLAVVQAEVDRKTVGQKVVKLTCSPPCRPSGNCYYDWYRGKRRSSSGEYVGCSYSASLWLDSTRSSDQDSYTCEVKNYSLPQQHCELPNQQWGVIYTAERVCALKGSSVDLSCTYKHPEGLTVTKSFWFIKSLRQRGVEPEDVEESDQYKGRVQYSRNLNSCRMTITDLRESDAQTYRFRFHADDPEGRYSGRGGVTLSVTDLKVTVSDTGGGVKELTCSSTCTLPNNPTYIWYKNGQPVSQCESASCPVAVVSEAVNYSCAVKGSDLHSPPVCGQKTAIGMLSHVVWIATYITVVFVGAGSRV
ncbi:hypothetical protein MHYP_G00061930 [Metynnis hypsauchen]